MIEPALFLAIGIFVASLFGLILISSRSYPGSPVDNEAHGSSHATILDPAHETANHAAITSLITLAWKSLDDARDYLLHIPLIHATALLVVVVLFRQQLSVSGLFPRGRRPAPA